jgi:RHS repeat-associated protein
LLTAYRAKFKYDPFGRRIYKSSTSANSIYAYDGDNQIEEVNASGGVIARYTQTEDTDEPLAMLKANATSYYQADGLGSTTSLSNGVGTLTQTYTFDSFGKTTNVTGSLTNPFQYTARELDSETGLYFYRARYYDQNTGRFLSEDPSGFSANDLNFYRYSKNNSANLVDPFGLNSSAPAIPWGRIWDKILARPSELPIPWGRVAGGVAVGIIIELVLPQATSSTDTIKPKTPLDCGPKDECKKQYANDLIWCEANFPEATDPMLWACYAIADENLANCLDGLPRVDRDPRNRPEPEPPKEPGKPEPKRPIPFPKPRRPRP